MSEFARVDSIGALQAFRASLCAFVDAARVAIDEADAELTRATHWLTEEHPRLRGQAARLREQANRANLELMNKQYTRELLDSAMSVVEERKALALIKRKLEQTEDTLQAVRRWQRELEREALAYRSGIQRMANVIDHDMPVAVALLDRMVTAIEAYLDTPAPATPRPARRPADADGTAAE